MSQSPRYLFESCELDIARRELTRGGEPVALEPQVFDLLVYVIRNRDRVVSKDDLVEAVWGGRIVSDSTLTTRINAMRKALGDSGEEQRLIRTVARKGIRFVGAVTEGKAVALAAATSAPEPPALALSDKPSIAVLAFQNLSGDPEQEYFSDGLAQDIITALSKWQWFFVIAHNSSFSYKGKAVDPALIGRELSVRYILEGAVRKASGKVRVTVQLVDALNGSHVWTNRYDREIADIFTVQDEIANHIAVALNVELTEAESKRRVRERPTSPTAMDLVLRARAQMNRLHDRGRGQVARARELLLQAEALDQTTPGLHSELARTHLNDFAFGWTEDREHSLAEGMAAAEQALKLDSRDPEAHLGKAVAHRFMGELERALGSVRASLDLNPNFALAQSHLADVLTQMGRPLEGCMEAERALRLDPRYPNGFRYLARACFHAERHGESVDWARKALHVAPNTSFPYVILSAALVMLGRFEEARQTVADLQRINPAASISRLRALDLPGGPHWQDQHERMYSALRTLGVPE